MKLIFTRSALVDAGFDLTEAKDGTVIACNTVDLKGLTRRIRLHLTPLGDTLQFVLDDLNDDEYSDTVLKCINKTGVTYTKL